jgi:hypothetical protein
MTESLVFTLPAGDTQLRAELEQVLEAYGKLREAPPTFGTLQDVVLFFDTIKDFGAMGVSVTTLVYLLKDKFTGCNLQVGKPGEKGHKIEEVATDEKVLHRLEELGKE